MKDAKEFLKQFIDENRELQKQIQEPGHDIFQLWPLVLNKLGLEILAQQSQVMDLERGHLRLAVRHSVFLQELKLRQGLWQPAIEAALRQQGARQARIKKVSLWIQSF